MTKSPAPSLMTAPKHGRSCARLDVFQAAQKDAKRNSRQRVSSRAVLACLGIITFVLGVIAVGMPNY